MIFQNGSNMSVAFVVTIVLVFCAVLMLASRGNVIALKTLRL